MQQMLRCWLACLWLIIRAGARLRSVPASCEAELPVAAVGELAAFERALEKAVPDHDVGHFKNATVVRKSDKYGAREGGCSEDVYGEVTNKGMTQLLDFVHLRASDVFVDLGSGLGKQPLRAAVLGGARAALGVELSAKRHQIACKGLDAAADALRAELKGRTPVRTSRVQLVHKDMFKQDLSNATVVFSNSVCFRNPMMKELAGKLARELPGSARFATLQPFMPPLPSRLIYDGRGLMDTHTIDTTWSPKVRVWILRTEGAPPAPTAR